MLFDVLHLIPLICNQEIQAFIVTSPMNFQVLLGISVSLAGCAALLVFIAPSCAGECKHGSVKMGLTNTSYLSKKNAIFSLNHDVTMGEKHIRRNQKMHRFSLEFLEV